MKMNCPCGNEVEQKVLNGIITYVHENGTSCKKLNKFYKDECAKFVWQKCYDAIVARDVDAFNIYMCVDTSDVSNYLCTYLEYASKDELVGFFDFVFRDTNIRVNIIDFLMRELIGQFARKAVCNLRACNSAIANEIMINKIAATTQIKKNTRKMLDVSAHLQMKAASSKENIISDLALSIMIDKAIKSRSLKEAIHNVAKR